MQLQPGSMAFAKQLQLNAVALGVGAQLSCFDAAKGAINYVMAQITEIGSATVTWEGTVDGTTWASIQAEPLATGTKAATATALGLYLIRVTGLTAMRANITTWASGDVSIYARGITQ